MTKAQLLWTGREKNLCADMNPVEVTYLIFEVHHDPSNSVQLVCNNTYVGL
jgi:hypothetical protein